MKKKMSAFILIVSLAVMVGCEGKADPEHNYHYSHADSIFMLDDDIYVVGSRDSEPCYWLNRKRVDRDISDDLETIMAKYNNQKVFSYQTSEYNVMVYVDKRDVYRNDNKKINDIFNPVMIKNGETTVLPMPENTEDGYSTGLAKNDSDVFILGYYYLDDIAGQNDCYWQNGTRIDFELEDFEGHMIKCFNQDLYILGDVYPDRYMFRNGSYTPVNIDSSLSVSDFYIDNNDYYYAGTVWYEDDTPFCAAYQKNGELTLLDKDNSHGNSVSIMNGDVYVTGKYETGGYRGGMGGGDPYTRACYWKNGEIVGLY